MIKFCNTESYHVHMRTLTEVLDKIENNQILPEGTIFYSKSLPHSINELSSLKEEREQWFERLLLIAFDISMFVVI